MFPFRRRKNPAEIHLAFQRAAEDWLRLPRGAQPDTVVLQAGQGRVTVETEDDTQDDAEKAKLSVTVLPPPGSRSESLSGVDPHLVPLLTPEAFEAEPYRVLAHLVGQMHTEADLRILAISSPSSGDGKTSTAINLAGILAQEPKIRVLLVEAELRRPSIAKYLGIRHSTGGLVGMVLEPTLALERVVQHCQPFNLDVLLAGHSSASPYDLLKLPRFGALLQEARKHYDYVIIDTTRRRATEPARSSRSTARRGGSCSSGVPSLEEVPLPAGARSGRALPHPRPGGRARAPRPFAARRRRSLPGARVDPSPGRRSTGPIQTSDLEEMNELVLSLDGRHLVIQGPPGVRQDVDGGTARSRT